MKLSIGELEKLTGMNRTALRYYDAEGVLDPQRQENGYRMYSEEDVMSLVQLKQLSAFGVELSELPGTRRPTDVRDVHRVLVGKEQAIEQEIEELYQKLSRLRLHVDAFGSCASGETQIKEGRMVGAYRLYYSGAQAGSSKVSRIFKRWMNAVPDTYSVVRIPAQAMDMPPETLCPVDTGIGLLSGAFRLIQKMGDISERDMFNTFNMGIGMSLVVAPDAADRIRNAIPDAILIGEIALGDARIELC